MKKLALLLLLSSINCFAEESSQSKEFSIGVGLGVMYSGLGANLSFLSENDLKYISAGCVEYSSVNGTACGLGAGWIKTDLFGIESNKHGFGLYAGIVGNETYYSDPILLNNSLIYYAEDSRDIYGAGVSYTYFVNGINQSGLTVGTSVHVTNAKSEALIGFGLQVGYQF